MSLKEIYIFLRIMYKNRIDKYRKRIILPRIDKTMVAVKNSLALVTRSLNPHYRSSLNSRYHCYLPSKTSTTNGRLKRVKNNKETSMLKYDKKINLSVYISRL